MNLLILFLEWGFFASGNAFVLPKQPPVRVWGQITARPLAHIANTDPAKLDPCSLISMRRKSLPAVKKQNNFSRERLRPRGAAGVTPGGY